MPLFNKFKFEVKNKLKRSQSFDPKEIISKRISLEDIPEDFYKPKEDNESKVANNNEDIEMANQNQKDHQAMITHISNNYIHSPTVTPRDRKEIQNALPAWIGWITTITGKTEGGNTVMPESVNTYFRQQIELYFNVVVRGWNVAIQSKEQDLYTQMGMNHITEIKKETKDYKIYNIHNHQGSKPQSGSKPRWTKYK